MSAGPHRRTLTLGRSSGTRMTWTRTMDSISPRKKSRAFNVKVLHTLLSNGLEIEAVKSSILKKSFPDQNILADLLLKFFKLK